jgi:hypothetical protein
MNRKRAKHLALALLLAGTGIIVFGRWALDRLGAAAPANRVPLAAGNVSVPTARTRTWNERSKLTDEILEYWAKHPLGDWRTDGKIGAPRALMGRFALQRDLKAANAYLSRVEPWGEAGSTWARHPAGDYDFTLAGLTPILFLFGDKPDVLFPDTRDHLLNVLLNLEGGDPLETVPRALGLVRDTENHLLMTEGSRYLKNRWLALHGSLDPRHDNVVNGLETWLLKLITELRTAGLYEFNSIPYEGYTLTALLNLEAFGSDSVRSAARDLLDQLNWKYALGSLSFRRFPPFRRQYSHAKDTALDGDRHVALMKTWASLMPDGPQNLALSGGHHVALWACWSPYRLPDDIAQWLVMKPRDYFVRLGHGPGGSPEIYSGGPGYLLTAGGVNRGERSMIVARPITLLLDDGATDLSQILSLSGAGDNFREWNNTGVWKSFAVAAGAVHVPGKWPPVAQGTLWTVYQRGDLCIAVFAPGQPGLVYLCRSGEPFAVLEAVEQANGNAAALQTSFQVPGGDRIGYDVAAPKDRWVITNISGRPTDRRFDRWPRIEEN